MVILHFPHSFCSSHLGSCVFFTDLHCKVHFKQDILLSNSCAVLCGLCHKSQHFSWHPESTSTCMPQFQKQTHTLCDVGVGFGPLLAWDVFDDWHSGTW